MSTDKLHISTMRSQLGRARGLGSGKAGTVEHWKIERLTAIGLIPLSIWFVVSMLRLLGAPQFIVVLWVSEPWNTVLLLALVALTFHHMQLGLQVVIDDYVHGRFTHFAATLVNKGAAILLGLFAAVAILKMAFLGPAVAAAVAHALSAQ
ncbi:succinate dehydrogenase / fumarate reductase membrane anchor subunit [Endobacter medicaginis]|jgi:succinate dehydrogenase / fumarate reductase, membrane anchor subunit|uniref:Succinate dehydrogenase hydrophobic membrane anchor subunit n=1 Tax=Endobacter medicaginis TaxID=1181271 RepID=A0A839V258_9PROT|nr:succinate dehydrogenase, hydrophobic membrane anchor protein [Endobacter medicaginis]MBB3174560.1 succinate dehydrogenase / fumarate reductase membrane anchor subunit [Endobacter medicaginis]MCX5474747.1 succinate dehydrogenase, hydrophobic membrane anchor protein [Endobacter medicaginis]NVN29169.1 succinate dehydrogenase, hydrophobic membrane anchor protein [Endobacter medicaginis]